MIEIHLVQEVPQLALFHLQHLKHQLEAQSNPKQESKEAEDDKYDQSLSLLIFIHLLLLLLKIEEVEYVWEQQHWDEGEEEKGYEDHPEVESPHCVIEVVNNRLDTLVVE